MQQVVNFSTRNQNALDLLITNTPSFVNNCIPKPGFGDHDSVFLSGIICHPHVTKPIKKQAQLEKTWFRRIEEKLQRTNANSVYGNTINITLNYLWQKLVPSIMSSSRYS